MLCYNNKKGDGMKSIIEGIKGIFKSIKNGFNKIGQGFLNVFRSFFNKALKPFFTAIYRFIIYPIYRLFYNLGKYLIKIPFFDNSNPHCKRNKESLNIILHICNI